MWVSNEGKVRWQMDSVGEVVGIVGGVGTVRFPVLSFVPYFQRTRLRFMGDEAVAEEG